MLCTRGSRKQGRGEEGDSLFAGGMDSFNITTPMAGTNAGIRAGAAIVSPGVEGFFFFFLHYATGCVLRG